MQNEDSLMSDPTQASTETAKAIAEAAKATGKTVDAVKATGGYIAKYTHGTIDQAMGILHDEVAYSRCERQIRLIDRSTEFLARRGLKNPPIPLPSKLAVPLLSAASLEDDDHMQDMRAQLLVNASVSESSQKRAFIDCQRRLQRGRRAVVGCYAMRQPGKSLPPAYHCTFARCARPMDFYSSASAHS
jgi:hypothetical protein